MSVSSSRLLSLWLCRFSTDRIAKTRNESREVTAPLAVYGKRGNAELIVAVDAAAERLGLTSGLALAQARAMHPGLEAVEENTEADASCSTPSPNGACVTRRWWRAIRPTACCSTSAAARIFRAASMR